jgi:hypothetical protein
VASKKSPENSISHHLTERGKVLATWIVSLICDSIFIAVWVLLNWGLDAQVIERLELKGVDHAILVWLKYLFGISTLIVVIIFIAEDLVTVAAQAYLRVKAKIRGGRS